MANESRFSSIIVANRDVVETLKAGSEDVVKERTLQAKIDRIDAETKQYIEEIKATPIDKELVRKQAKEDFENAKKQNSRNTKDAIVDAEDEVEKCKLMLDETAKLAKRRIEEITSDFNSKVREVENAVKKAERNLTYLKETAKESEESANLKAQQEYERTIASIGNIEQTINLRVQKATVDGENKKQALKIELDTVKAKISAHKEIVSRQERVYNDIKEMGTNPSDLTPKGKK